MRTFKEREDARGAVFGTSHLPGAPEGPVLSINVCGSGDHAVLIPGACLQVYPPAPKRPTWVYATVGLSQPRDPDDKPWDGERGERLSAQE